MAASLRLSAVAVAAAAAVDKVGRGGGDEKVRQLCAALVASAPSNPSLRHERDAFSRLAAESPSIYAASLLRGLGLHKEGPRFLIPVLPELSDPSLLLPVAPVPYGTRARHLARGDTELQVSLLLEDSTQGVRPRALSVLGASSTSPWRCFLGAPMAATPVLRGLGHAEKGDAVLEPNDAMVGAQPLSWLCSEPKVQAPRLMEASSPRLRRRALSHHLFGHLITGFTMAIPRPCRLILEARPYHKAAEMCECGTGGRAWPLIRHLGGKPSNGASPLELLGTMSNKTKALTVVGAILLGGIVLFTAGIEYNKLLQQTCEVEEQTAKISANNARKERYIDRVRERWTYAPGARQPPMLTQLQAQEQGKAT